MRMFLKQTIYLVPIIMLIGTLLSCFIDFNYVIVGNILGCSLLTNTVFFFHFYYGKYCWFTRLSPIGLCIINIVDIIGNYLSNTFYNYWYIIAVFSVILTLSIIFELQKRFK